VPRRGSQRPDLGPRQLARVGILELHTAGAGRHHLDEVRPSSQLLADGAADVVGTVGFAVHAVKETAAGSGGRHDPTAAQQAWPGERAVAHTLARFEHKVAVGADVPQRRDPPAQRLAQVGGEEVRIGAGP